MGSLKILFCLLFTCTGIPSGFSFVHSCKFLRDYFLRYEYYDPEYFRMIQPSLPEEFKRCFDDGSPEYESYEDEYEWENMVSSESKNMNKLSNIKIPPNAKLTESTMQSKESNVNTTESSKEEILANAYSTNSLKKEILTIAKSTEPVTSKAESSIHSTESSKQRIVSSIYSTKPALKEIALSTYSTVFSVPDISSIHSIGSSEQDIALSTYSTKPSKKEIASNIYSTASSAPEIALVHSTEPPVKEIVSSIYSTESSVNEISSSTSSNAFSVPDKAINVYSNESLEHGKELNIHSTESSVQLIAVNANSTKQVNEEMLFTAELIEPTKYQIPRKTESNREVEIDISSSEKSTEKRIEESRDETRENDPLYVKPILEKLTTKYLAFTNGVDPLISLKPILHQIKHPLNEEYHSAAFGIVAESGSEIVEDEEREVRKTLIKVRGSHSTENILLGIFLVTGCVLVLASGMYMIAMKKRRIQHDELRLLPELP